ncbi:MAG: DUF6288 domain-containing protein [Akkermansiaceae bacterium]
MKLHFYSLICLLAASPNLVAEPPVLAGLPKYQTPTPIPSYRNWYITQNLGPTGMRGWIYGAEGHTRGSLEIQVKSIEAGSPAEGPMKRHDIIIGAAIPPNTPAHQWNSAPKVRKFDADARMEMARAITWAESDAGKGELHLLVARDGKEGQVTLRLPVLGAYAKTAPFDCPKTSKIVDQAIGFLAESTPAEGYSSGVGRPMAAALLLASEQAEYLDHVRRSACRMSLNHEVSEAGHETWRWGNNNLFLCEYYLATGDKRVLPTIQEYSERLVAGQSNPGTWGHKIVENFIPPGYGVINSTGIVCFLSLVLADECGVEFDRQGIVNSVNFYGSYVGRGGIPYGDHAPTVDPTSNGKNGGAAVAFHLLGAERATNWFGGMAASANLLYFENGHSGNYFNQTWTPLGVSVTGKKNYVNFWERFNSYRDLARRKDGSFMTQPWPHKREGDLGAGNYVRKGPIWSTGGFALSYLAGSERLAILGRTESVFGADIPAVFGPALSLYEQRKFPEAAKAAELLLGEPEFEKMAKQLIEISQRNIESAKLTLQSMERNLEAGDVYALSRQLQAIESIVDSKDTSLAKFYRAVEDPKNEQVMKEGVAFHRGVSNVAYQGPKGSGQILPRGSQLDGLASRSISTALKAKDSPYTEIAKTHVAALPVERSFPNRSLLNPSKENPAVWKMMASEEVQNDRWKSRNFADGGWEETKVPINKSKGSHSLRTQFKIDDLSEIESMMLSYQTTGAAKVFLNGTMILHVDPIGGQTKYDKADILLKDITRELLLSGENVLAVEIENPKSVSSVNFDLKASIQ